VMDDDLTLRAFRRRTWGSWTGWIPIRPRSAPSSGSGSATSGPGAALLPEHRGRGLGTLAQRRLVDHLFRFTTVHRLEAGTDAENHAEQKALERIGFTREGVLREVAFRDGAWRDCVLYSLLRDQQPR
jgi:[ribosomal protein S5]-alanine N-acetyltransferase